ncbi:PspA/IM30 family protein [Ectothiorhodospiraceae bacterium 2226]|nr:PspA/IM30 family protein [Ectothiorhodospiraceae bacterium 2226]
MSESLVSRIGRLVSGSIQQIVSAAENAAPETVMAEAIRQVDDAIDEVRAELGRTKAHKHNASQRLASESARQSELEDKIRFALQEDREDLAEAAVAMQLDIEAQLPVIEKNIAEAGARETELENYLRALQGRKREMQAERERVASARRESRAGDAQAGGAAARDGVERRVDQANMAFDRVAQAVTGAPGPTQAADPAKLAELEEMTRKHRIRERLAQFKKQHA